MPQVLGAVVILIHPTSVILAAGAYPCKEFSRGQESLCHSVIPDIVNRESILFFQMDPR
jgi:hypothetical protein